MNKFKYFVYKNSPVILSVIGATGVIITSGLTIKATIKANNLYNSLDNKEELNKKDIVRLFWKEYIPAGISASATIICIFGASYINQKMKASLISAYYLLQNSYMDYKNATNELYENADSKIRHKLFEDKYSKENISLQNDDTEIFFDYWSGSFFESTMDEMLRHESEFLETLSINGWVSINEWEHILGNRPMINGDILGWYSNEYHDVNGYPDVEVIFEPDTMSNGLKCNIINFSMEPEIMSLYPYSR